MTRINLVHPSELHQKHLVAEYREIVRVFALVRNRLEKKTFQDSDIPSEYVLGSGHVTFFFDKLGFVADRYESLIREMKVRGYKPNPIRREELEDRIDPRLFKNYVPTPEALTMNRNRIKDRLPKD